VKKNCSLNKYVFRKKKFIDEQSICIDKDFWLSY